MLYILDCLIWTENAAKFSSNEAAIDILKIAEFFLNKISNQEMH